MNSCEFWCPFLDLQHLQDGFYPFSTQWGPFVPYKNVVNPLELWVWHPLDCQMSFKVWGNHQETSLCPLPAQGLWPTSQISICLAEAGWEEFHPQCPTCQVLCRTLTITLNITKPGSFWNTFTYCPLFLLFCFFSPFLCPFPAFSRIVSAEGYNSWNKNT